MTNARGAGALRISYLDGLRGLAAMSVVMDHFTQSYSLPTGLLGSIMHTPLSVLWDGRAAVSLFFVLSGFVLSLKYFRQPRTGDAGPASYLNYVVSRVGRIWLPYVAMVTLSLLLKWYVRPDYPTIPVQSAWVHGLWTDRIGVKAFILETNLFVAPTRITLVPQAWSLFAEMTISLLIPFAVLVARRGLLELTFVGGLLVASLGAPIYVVHFVLGVVIAKNYSSGTLAAKNGWTAAALAVSGLALYGARDVQPYLGLGPVPGQMMDGLNGIGAAALITLTLCSSRLQRLLDTRPIRHLGKVSYSIYLCHIAMLLCLTPAVFDALRIFRLATPVAAWAIGLVITLGGTWLIASLLYALVEAPALALARKINNWIAVYERHRRQAPPTVPNLTGGATPEIAL